MLNVPNKQLIFQFWVIFVIGCTGTGKSDLGVAIAKKYGGEVISVDSMQFYKGLDIATNKITKEESDGIPHHMMSFLDPSTTSKYHVHSFREETLKIIQKLQEQQKVPVIVGGTTYYAESVLYLNNFIETLGKTESESEDSEAEISSEAESTSNQELWNELNEVDPESAKYLHPNNRYRVKRALQIYKTTGRRKSDFLRDQKRNENIDLPGQLRFENSLVIYMDAKPDVLEDRLDSRVDKMIRLGLKKELIQFYEDHKQYINNNSYGVMQCIGLKEFVPWLKYSDRESETGQKLFKSGCDDVKLHTRQYAKRQRRWYLSRFLRRSSEERKMASTKMLDTSNKDQIISDGMAIVDEWMNGVNLYETAPESENEILKAENANILIECELCALTMTGKNQWEKHVSGKSHKHKLKKLKEAEQQSKLVEA